MESLTQNFNAFKASFEKGGDLKSLQEQVVKLKIEMTKFGFLQSSQPNERKIARNILEYSALLCIKSKDIAGFERNVAQVQTYYGMDGDEDSPLKYEILGLNLLNLLASDKMAMFHTELELIPVAKRNSDKFIQFPIAMEQYMMEGSYHKVINSTEKVPSQSFTLFFSILADTVRVQIAECISHAYSFLSEKEVRELLMLSASSNLDSFVKQFGWRQTGSGFDFGKKNVEEGRIPKVTVMQQTLNLANELERIV